MKKFYLLPILILSLTSSVFAQNVLLYENFEDTTTYSNILISLSNGMDTTWIDADYDGLPDQSGANPSRADEWFLSRGFADVDSTNTVMMSNSWTLDPTPVANYLILPPIYFTGTDGMLSWKHAPRQTPRFLDGMQVLVSTAGNFPEDFTDTLKIYAEYTDGTAVLGDSSFAYYQFSSGFVFGLDQQYIEFHGDSARFIGILRPDSASLAAYAGQNIYIAFCHGTTDDNLIEVDDIKVTGTGEVTTVDNPTQQLSQLIAYPNPATDNVRVSYSNITSGVVHLNLFDIAGKIVKPISNSGQIRGNYFFDVSTKDLANGVYTAVLENAAGKSMVKITVQN